MYLSVDLQYYFNFSLMTSKQYFFWAMLYLQRVRQFIESFVLSKKDAHSHDMLLGIV